MAITQGYKVLASDVNNTLDSLIKAYKVVKDKNYTWQNKPIYGNLIDADLITEIKEIANACLTDINGISCNSNYRSKASNSTTDPCNVEINEVNNYSG